MSQYIALKRYGDENRGGGGGTNNNDISSNGRNQPTEEDLHSEMIRKELLLNVKNEDEPQLSHALKHARATDLDHIFTHPDSCTLLHIAAQRNSPKMVQLLLEAGADCNIKDLRGGKFTALHYAAQFGCYEVVRILLQNGAEANAKEGKFGRSCLHILTLNWQKAEDDYVKTLDEFLKHRKLNIDSKDSNNATPLYMAALKTWEYMARTLILKDANLEVEARSKTVREMIDENLPHLLASIDLKSIEPRKRFYGDELYDALRSGDLDLFKSVVREINDKEISSKSSILEEDHGDYTCLNYACDNALHEYVEVLLSEGADVTRKDQTTKLCPILYAAKNGYYKVMELLVENMKKHGILKRGALNAADRKGETPLHKVVKREQPTDKEGVDYLRCFQILFNLKGHLEIDAQDEFYNTPLHYAVLCDDQSFVRDLLMGGAHLGIKNIFGTLAISRIQPTVLEDILNKSVKFSNNMTNRDFEIVLHYSMLAPGSKNAKPETDFLKFLSESKRHRHLLLHPIIDTFLFLKWQRIRHYYFINLFAYTAFVLLLTTYIFLFFGIVNEDTIDRLSNSTSPFETSGIVKSVEVRMTLQVLILIAWMFGAIREVIQAMVSCKTYFSSLENWLELAILFMTIFAIFIPMPYIPRQSLSAWLILSSWIEFVLILGRHPWFAVYITMFTTVTFNFLKFIMIFSFMIFAFSISFFLVFQIDGKFSTYSKSLLKTIAMSTGEIEYSELPLSDFPISSHLLFVLFVFLIVLVLMNLLNGLAVSDIQLIQKEAEIVSFRRRVELIAYIESVFLSNPFLQSSCGKICNFDDCCFKRRAQPCNPFTKLIQYLGNSTLMFEHCLKDHRIMIYPNRYPNMDLKRWHVCDCHSLKLEESQIENVKSVILAEDDRLAEIEFRITDMANMLRNLTDIVQRNNIQVKSAE